MAGDYMLIDMRDNARLSASFLPMHTRQHNPIQDQDFSDIDGAGVLAALASILAPTNLLHAAEDLRPYECDALSAYRALPLAVALPENEAQVVAVLKACH